MPENSRVWVYQSNREFSPSETNEIIEAATEFVSGWTAHDNKLKASFDVRYNRFVILSVDESQAGASGCSIDKSLKFIKDLEEHFKVKLLDRMAFAYKKNEKVHSCSSVEFGNMVEEGLLNDYTTVYNNLVSNIADLKSKWEVPLKDSWHKQFVG